MNKQLIVAALATLALAACSDEKPSTPAPGADTSGSAAPATDSTATGSAASPTDSTTAGSAASTTDSSASSAASTPGSTTGTQSGAVGAAPTPGTGADHATGESDEMTKKEESTQMPQPGQANDHSNTREQGGTGVIRP
jgi:hypothetical protein